jgi:hypothetical protein
MSQVVTSREDVIRVRAYQLWEEAGSPPGDGVDFWLQAESEFDEEFSDALDATLDEAVEEFGEPTSNGCVRVAAK